MPALPGCVTQGETLTETPLMAEEAITLIWRRLPRAAIPCPSSARP
ncbi:MAG: type II toxin-antitoxin system HicB family antitoxin [Armatimonadota bacterium]